jgi:hypothetical protein
LFISNLKSELISEFFLNANEMGSQVYVQRVREAINHALLPAFFYFCVKVLCE